MHPCDQPVIGLSHHRRRPAGDAGAGLGTDRQHRSAHGLTASPYQIGLYRGQAWGCRAVQDDGAGNGGEGITCNAICPGYVLTPLVEAQIPEQMKVHGMDRDTVIREVMLLRQPSRQFATVDQIGGTTVYLCSPAADQVTGTTISVDGGWTAL
jgi:3-hydroxybutyrate dehydrogenase